MIPIVLQQIQQRLQLPDAIIDDIYSNPENFYKVYTIKKGSKYRQIEEPLEPLKSIQRELLQVLEEEAELHPACTCVKGKGIAANAEIHRDARYLLRIDIKDCYQRICFYHVIDKLSYALCQAEQFLFLQHYLPTGAPTSPFLCNLALKDIDEYVQEIADYKNYRYSRYLDDIILSTTEDQRDWVLLGQIEAELQDRGFKINRKKSKWLTVDKDQLIITGVRIANGERKVPKDLKLMMRARLQNIAKDNKPLDEQTKGYLSYINSISPKEHSKMVEYYEKRCNYVPPIRSSISPQ